MQRRKLGMSDRTGRDAVVRRGPFLSSVACSSATSTLQPEMSASRSETGDQLLEAMASVADVLKR